MNRLNVLLNILKWCIFHACIM